MNGPHERASLEQLIAGNADFVRALARSLVGDATEAEDLAQEAWLAVSRRGAPDGASPRAWLGGVLRRVASRRHRTDRRRRRREAMLQTATRGDHPPARREACEHVLRAVLELDEPFRSTVIQRFYDGLEPSEIAELDGVPPATVRSRLTRALERLRRRLDATYGSDRRAWAVPLAAFAFRDAAPMTSVTTVLAGALTMKKTVILSGIALVALWFGVVRPRFASDDDATIESAEVTRLGASTTPRRASESRPPRDAAESPDVIDEASEVAAVTEDTPLAPGRVVVRIIRGDEAKPAAGIGVRLEPLGAAPHRFHQRREAVTDASGIAVFDAVPPGMLSVVTDRHLRTAVALASGGDEEVHVTLPHGSTLRGLVVDAQGRPLGDARLFLAGIDRDGHWGARTGSDGTFRLEDLPRQIAYVAARHEVHGVSPLEMIRTEQGGLVEDVRLVVDGGTGRIEGVVTDAEGRPVEGAVVLSGAETGVITLAFADMVTETGLGAIDLQGRQVELSDKLREFVAERVDDEYGLAIDSITMNISLPDEITAAMTRGVARGVEEGGFLDNVGDMGRYQQAKAAEAMVSAAGNPGGSAMGDALSMGMGVAMAGQMANTMGQAMNPGQQAQVGRRGTAALAESGPEFLRGDERPAGWPLHRGPDPGWRPTGSGERRVAGVGQRYGGLDPGGPGTCSGHGVRHPAACPPGCGWGTAPCPTVRSGRSGRHPTGRCPARWLRAVSDQPPPRPTPGPGNWAPPPVPDEPVRHDPQGYYAEHQVDTRPCHACGGELVFDIGSQALSCPHCGATEAIVHHPGAAVEEQSYTRLLHDGGPRPGDPSRRREGDRLPELRRAHHLRGNDDVGSVPVLRQRHPTDRRA